jgi:hypothetical protein
MIMVRLLLLLLLLLLLKDASGMDACKELNMLWI